MNDRNKDDNSTGRILSRREIFSIIGGVAGAGVLGEAEGKESLGLPRCIGRPEQTEGPYFLETNLNRSDIRTEPSDGSISDGIPVSLEFTISRISGQGCVPLGGAIVHLWHCDANGFYSGVQDPSFNTSGKSFLRGYQITNAAGSARFETIFPGWYPGRTVHMHFKIRTSGPAGRGSEFTSQLYFEDTLTDRIFMKEPYRKRGRRSMHNVDDFIFRSGGKDLILSLSANDNGYAGTFEIGLT